MKLTRDIGGAYLGGVLYSKLGKYAAPVTERAEPTRSSRSRGWPTVRRRPA